MTKERDILFTVRQLRILLLTLTLLSLMWGFSTWVNGQTDQCEMLYYRVENVEQELDEVVTAEVLDLKLSPIESRLDMIWNEMKSSSSSEKP